MDQAVNPLARDLDGELEDVGVRQGTEEARHFPAEVGSQLDFFLAAGGRGHLAGIGTCGRWCGVSGCACVHECGDGRQEAAPGGAVVADCQGDEAVADVGDD
ncbi:hypothetical protein [Streptomyces axinellae]|uniref:Uncharacterized protein n=1 Tax=Streptomyces axinellae TaxID=552788 RepID=A0ABP6DFN9_9ACTN